MASNKLNFKAPFWIEQAINDLAEKGETTGTLEKIISSGKKTDKNNQTEPPARVAGGSR